MNRLEHGTKPRLARVSCDRTQAQLTRAHYDVSLRLTAHIHYLTGTSNNPQGFHVSIQNVSLSEGLLWRRLTISEISRPRTGNAQDSNGSSVTLRQ